ncbi:MAG TPA: F-box protein, partial [Saprospiraceae bacterium]|nr:F-box protein [Saprospiraceae bacterium]
MDNLPTDIIGIIFEHLDTKNLIFICRTCRKFRNTFRKYIGKYKIDLSSHCDKIKDEDLIYFAGVQHIELRNCKKITDKGLKYLKGVHTINLWYCNK